MDESWRAAWESALDDLELTLEETEHLLRGEHPPPQDGPVWTPPVLPGPLPPEMADRARALLARQQDVIARTAQAALSARTSVKMVDRLTDHSTPTRRTSLYVDVSA